MCEELLTYLEGMKVTSHLDQFDWNDIPFLAISILRKVSEALCYILCYNSSTNCRICKCELCTRPGRPTQRSGQSSLVLKCTESGQKIIIVLVYRTISAECNAKNRKSISQLVL